MASTQKKTTKGKKAPPKPEPPAYNGMARLIGGIVCLLLALCVLVTYFNVDAILLTFLANVLKGCMGYGYWLAAPALLYAGIVLVGHKGRPVKLRTTCTLLVPLLAGVLWHLIFCRTAYELGGGLLSLLWKDGQTLDCGGVVAGGLALGSEALVSKVVSIIIFLIYYIINSMGERAAKNGSWEIWFGTWISTFVTLPLGIFFTYKATRDSGVFNADVYMATIRKLLGIRTQRHLFKKEVIIEDPDYRRIDTDLDALCAECEDYMRTHRLDHLPNYARLFTNNEKDTRIRELSNRLETLVEELANSKDHMVLRIASTYPVLITDAHTSPFSNRWLNMLVGLVVPVGLFFYIRVWRFGLRLNKDLRQIITTSRNLQERIRSEELN